MTHLKLKEQVQEEKKPQSLRLDLIQYFSIFFWESVSRCMVFNLFLPKHTSSSTLWWDNDSYQMYSSNVYLNVLMKADTHPVILPEWWHASYNYNYLSFQWNFVTLQILLIALSWSSSVLICSIYYRKKTEILNIWFTFICMMLGVYIHINTNT